jgi:rubrerythrin
MTDKRGTALRDEVVIDTVEELLAHALTLETEATERFEEIADNLEVHNNPEVAALFRKLAEYGHKHIAEVEDLAKSRTLPEISPWDFKWPDAESPESTPIEETHYMMTPYQALTLAQKVERNAHAFYALVADSTPNDEVRRVSTEFAEEEAEHVRLLDDWIKRFPKPDDDWDYDPDPPIMPE